ncbi:hypothetical protein GCM10010347_00240 [Streptomyces cirratus]|uniref:Secreted protein n=1 Tax=Streptomyces cirratus TaxID=68187 RepID=A0ABQ3EDY1_9ACTN|nr:hypothetical protein [Streptomyces cirratus]GHB35077.1 hypothetical protein GCM10010347_00240 [Streptomyces cirratus]
MGARPSRAVSLLVTSVALAALLIPGAVAQPVPAAGEQGIGGQGVGSRLPEGIEGQAAGAEGAAVVDLAEIPAEPPVPSAPPARELFGADCDTVIEASQVTAYCHNSFPRTDLVRLHVECDRWWDVDGDGAAVAVGPAGRVELSGRCWKEVRSAWVSHEPG